jgi:predicted RNA-binding protein (virulence factor B family)
MTEIGKINRLRIIREVDFGVYLDGAALGEILLPEKYLPKTYAIDDTLEVFIYLDSQDRLIATTETPFAQVGEFTLLKVIAVNRMGAFLDWGLSKDLLVPFREQQIRMDKGCSYIVHIYLDHKSQRIAASSRLEKFFNRDIKGIKSGQEVNLLIFKQTSLGYKAVIDNNYQGMIFKNEVFRPLKIGQKITGYIKKIREDGKIDLSLNKSGYDKIEDQAEKVLSILQKNNGYIAVSDKTAPEIIYNIFGMSKKSYKMAVGKLFRERQIIIEDNGIREIKQSK